MSSSADDPGSLSRLHDIVVPPPASWWPLAPAWYVVGAVILVGVVTAIAIAILRWQANRYRRAGLAELRQLEQSQPDAPKALFQLAELLKRVALVAYPRPDVAALTGVEWLSFLDRAGGMTAFSNGPGRLLMSVYDREPPRPTQELFLLVRLWIRQHRRSTEC